MKPKQLRGPAPVVRDGGSTERVHVFAYGSNLDRRRMHSRVPSAVPLGRADLVGHELRFHKRSNVDGTGKADAFHTGRESDVVHGVVYEIAAHELQDLDRAEGLGNGYVRVQHELSLLDADGRALPDGQVRAWAYHAQPGWIDDTLRPLGWYRQHVLDGALEHRLPEALVARLRREPTSDGGESDGFEDEPAG